jgi:TgpA N-terminal domain/Transglutaminase-like superfamily
MTALSTEGPRSRFPPGVGQSLRGAAMPAVWVVMVVVIVGLSALPWLRGFQVTGVAELLAVAAVASVAITFYVAGYLAKPPLWSYTASLIGLVILSAALTAGHPTHLWRGLTQGPTRLLTETLPLSGSLGILAAPILLTWLCGAATAELLTRTRRSAGGLVVPVAAFALAYATTSGAAQSYAISGPLLLGALALTALLRHRQVESHRGVVDISAGAGDGAPTPPHARSQYSPGWRAVGTGAALAVAATAALGYGIPHLPGIAKHSASLVRPAPKTTGLITDPVDAVAQLRDADPHASPVPMFSVRTNRRAPAYYGIATLDDYDGGTWTFDTTFHPSGGRIPPAPTGSPGAVSTEGITSVTQHYSIGENYDLGLVPTIDRPVEVRGLAVDADASSAMILPAKPGVLAKSYTVVSHAPDVTLSAIPRADGIGVVRGALDPVEVADTAIPTGTASDIASATRFLSNLTGQRPAPTVAFLQAVETALRDKEKRVDPADPLPKGTDAVAATGGTSLAGVINAIAVLKAATPEQFATLFVMVARFLGVPARLVTGFRAASGGVAAAGSHTLTDRDAWTWAEIPVAGIGWVVADPTPLATTAAAAAPPEAVQAAPTTLPRQANAVPKSEIDGGHAIAPPTPVHVPSHHHGSRALEFLLIALAAVVVLLGIGPAVAGSRRLIRRRSRRAKDPAVLAAGAWLEVLDALSQAGMPSSVGATTTEVAVSAVRHFGEAVQEPIRETGVVADQAVYAVSSPPDLPSAEQAWQRSRTVRRAALATLDRRQRLRATVAVGRTPRRPTSRQT